MKRSRQAWWPGPLVVLVMVATASVPWPASAAPAGSPTPTPSLAVTSQDEAELTAEQRGVSVEEVLEETDWQTRFNVVSTQIERRLPDAFVDSRVLADGRSGIIRFAGAVPAEAREMLGPVAGSVSLAGGEALSARALGTRLEKAYRAVLEVGGVANATAYAADDRASLVVQVELSSPGRDSAAAADLEAQLERLVVETSGLATTVTLVDDAGDIEVGMRGGGNLNLTSGPAQ